MLDRCIILGRFFDKFDFGCLINVFFFFVVGCMVWRFIFAIFVRKILIGIEELNKIFLVGVYWLDFFLGCGSLLLNEVFLIRIFFINICNVLYICICEINYNDFM